MQTKFNLFTLAVLSAANIASGQSIMQSKIFSTGSDQCRDQDMIAFQNSDFLDCAQIKNSLPQGACVKGFSVTCSSNILALPKISPGLIFVVSEVYASSRDCSGSPNVVTGQLTKTIMKNSNSTFGTMTCTPGGEIQLFSCIRNKVESCTELVQTLSDGKCISAPTSPDSQSSFSSYRARCISESSLKTTGNSAAGILPSAIASTILALLSFWIS